MVDHLLWGKDYQPGKKTWLSIKTTSKYVQVSQVCPSTASEDFLEGSHFPKAEPRGVFSSKAISVLVHSNTFKNLRFVDMLWQRQLNQDAMHLHIFPHGFHVPKVGKFPHSLAFIEMWFAKSSPDLWIFVQLLDFCQNFLAYPTTHTLSEKTFLDYIYVVLQLFQHPSDPTSNEQSLVAPLQKLSQGGGHQSHKNRPVSKPSTTHSFMMAHQQKGMWPPPLSQPSFCSWPFFQFPTESSNDQLDQEGFRTAANYHSETPGIGLWIRSFTHQQHGKSRCDTTLCFEFLLRKSREKKQTQKTWVSRTSELAAKLLSFLWLLLGPQWREIVRNTWKKLLSTELRCLAHQPKTMHPWVVTKAAMAFPSINFVSLLSCCQVSKQNSLRLLQQTTTWDTWKNVLTQPLPPFWRKMCLSSAFCFVVLLAEKS